MRSCTVFIVLFELTSLTTVAQTVTVAQLYEFLTDRNAAKRSDRETADRLSTITLSERLTPRARVRIAEGIRLGPLTAEQLELLAESSVGSRPPIEEMDSTPPPKEEKQQELLTAAREYADKALYHLPDFIATRATRRYDNAPQYATGKRARPEIRLHWIGEFNGTITYRNGHEVTDSEAAQSPAHSGLLSWGEFGPILSVVLRDSLQGSVTWSYWEQEEQGNEIAVFQFSVPKSSSHYSIDFCCYRLKDEDSRDLSFRGHPAYHGSFSFDPVTSTIRKITINADMEDNVPIASSTIAVQYGDVDIGGRSYVCPVHSVAISEIRNEQLKRLDGIGIEKHFNEVRFLNYHKFGSTSRMITAVH